MTYNNVCFFCNENICVIVNNSLSKVTKPQYSIPNIKFVRAILQGCRQYLLLPSQRDNVKVNADFFDGLV